MNRAAVVRISVIPGSEKTSIVGTTWKDVSNKTSFGETKTMGMQIIYKFIERTIDKHGQILMIPDIELYMFWAKLEWSNDDVITSPHAHWECEQYHSELKSDMDVGWLPSGKYASNALVLELAMIAFNILRMIRQESLKHKQPTKRKIHRRRLRTVIENMMLCASHFTKHARHLIMALECSNTCRHTFWGVWQRFALS